MAGVARSPRFDGRVAIVTGSTGRPGIGRSCAEGLAREGASVVINGRNEERLKEAERDFKDAGWPVATVLGSPADEEIPARLAETAVDAFGTIDIVVNVVGGAQWAGPPLEMQRDGFLETVTLNAWSSAAVLLEAMKRGLADGGGAVVNTSSSAYYMTNPSMIAYKAANLALNGLTETFARELGPMGVRVNGVAPGFTMSAAVEAILGRDTVREGAVLRFSEPEDTANAVLFLASDEAATITGITINVDGGDHLIRGWTPFTTDKADWQAKRDAYKAGA